MVKDPRRRRVASSPYSRTGLFPWGNTYDVPAHRSGHGYASQTPCHLRNVRLAPDDPTGAQVVRCAACGRVWTVRLKPNQDPPIAIWTA